MKAKDHYDKHLGNFYSWMTGNFAEIQSEQEDFFKRHAVFPVVNKLAYDLGAGHGLQTVSLANIGFSVKAVDFNNQLLEELKANTTGLNVEIINNDLLSFLKDESTHADCIVCMGDTLTHLESIEDVDTFIRYTAQRLIKRGKLVLSFRDLSIPLANDQRFISVRSDDSRILTCFLEYFPTHVMVHDLLHEKEKNGNWILRVSSYPKLKITEPAIKNLLLKNKLTTIHTEVKNRMIYLIAEKI